MTKVLLVISKYLPEYTGAAYRIDGLYRRLQQSNKDIELEIICNSTSEESSKTYNYNGFSVRRIVFPWKLLWLPVRVRNAIKVYYEAIVSFFYIARKKPDIIHIVGYSGATISAFLYGRIYKIPRLIELVTCYATPLQYLPALRYPNFLRLSYQTAIIAISRKLADDCAKINLVDNVWCRPNPIDETKFIPSLELKNELRLKLLPYDKDDIVIAMVAKFMPQKNQVFLIEVLKLLPDKYKLVLTGPLAETGMFKDRDQEYFENIKNLIKQYNLGNRVYVCAEFVDAGEYMKASDLYVMPQYTEGLGTPMLEAIACGLPVVANASESAFVEWIKDGENGYLCEMEAKLWANAIIKALEISRDKLKKSASYIDNVASVTRCNKNYNKLINALIKTNIDEELKIKNVI